MWCARAAVATAPAPVSLPLVRAAQGAVDRRDGAFSCDGVRAADNRYAARRVIQASGDGLVAVRRERDKPDGGTVSLAAGADSGTLIRRGVFPGGLLARYHAATRTRPVSLLASVTQPLHR